MKKLDSYFDVMKKTPMFSLLKSSSRKAGLPPGSSVYVGEQRVDRVSITIIDYDENNLRQSTPASLEECFIYKDTPSISWINIDGLHDTETISRIGAAFGLHPLIIEDVLNTTQRPKIDVHDEYVYMVLRMHSYDVVKHEVTTEQVSIVLGTAFLLTFQEKPGDIFDPVRERLKTGRGRIRRMGHDYLAYSLLDSVVDSYFSVLEKVGEEIDQLEENLLNAPTPEMLRRIHFFKREMILMRKAVWPLREVISTLQREEVDLVSDAIMVYLRDLHDHTIQVIDTVETFRDMLSSMVEIYLSSISNRMNEVMKVLTIFAAIFIPLTLIAGIYGMNFNTAKSPLNMPELDWYFGYPFALILMALVGFGMMMIFKRKGWF
jgi:magnesium transporter